MQNNALYCKVQFIFAALWWYHISILYFISMNFTVWFYNFSPHRWKGIKNTTCFLRWFISHYNVIIEEYSHLITFTIIYYQKCVDFCAIFYGRVYHNGIVPYNAIWCHISLFILHCNGITDGYYVSINFTMFFQNAVFARIDFLMLQFIIVV